jgi:hypothetical protein
MWLRHTTALATAIAEDCGLPEGNPTCAALAHLALEAPRTARSHGDPREAITRAFDLLEHGWLAASE